MRVEIWADVLCPWCSIAERRVRRAVASLEDPTTVSVVWRSYELAPELGRTPGPTAAAQMRADDWWGERADERIERIRLLGAAEGVELDLHRARPVSTFDAHRLVHLAAAHDLADIVMADLLHAHHTDGRNVADPSVLHDIGQAAGVPGDEVLALLGSDAYADEVLADGRRAHELGIRSVPTIVVDDQPPLPGVPTVDDLRRLLSGGDRAVAPGETTVLGHLA